VWVGLRKGEALALTWDDVDLDGAEVTVRGTLRRVPGVGLVVNKPKSEGGTRTVALPPIAVDALRRRRQTQRLERSLPSALDGHRLRVHH
jgi:integrase